MERWDMNNMLDIGRKLFVKIHQRKKHASPNHDVHFMAREIDEWLPQGIQSLIDGTYDPRCLKRIYFPDEMVDQVHLSDRIFQHILLKIVKPTFKYVMNPNCYHLYGPSGVKYATERIKQTLEEEKPQYFIRADIKSFYRNIPHHKLIQDIKQHYDDPKLIAMLKNIITNPIDTPYGFKNPIHGITLRGPLSQFFSGIYLKPLDDAFDSASVTYVRFQDDLIIFCKTKRQLNRCRRKLSHVLQERHLTLSRKKSRIGHISQGFHFLGVDYPATQPQGNTSKAKTLSCNDANFDSGEYLSRGGGREVCLNEPSNLTIKPHARTLHKARENIKAMVADGLSIQKIKAYIKRWAAWWAKTVINWDQSTIISWLVVTCWDSKPAAIAASTNYPTLLDTRAMRDDSAWDA